MGIESGRLDGVHFARSSSWRERVSAFLLRAARGGSTAFLSANVDCIRRTLDEPSTGPRFIVNIPADALLSFLSTKQYKNAYERPTVAGKTRGPSPTRVKVDKLLGLGKAEQYYFGAVALGGTGIRFYGQYTLVLRPDRTPATTGLFDRNSYDLLRAPLADAGDPQRVVRVLRGSWRENLADMLTMKLLPSLSGSQRLLTAGAISEGALHDEDFIEAHRRGSFTLADVEEIRQAPEDQLVASQLEDQRRAGVPLTLAEHIWRARRKQVDRAMRGAKIRTRVVASSARTDRWR